MVSLKLQVLGTEPPEKVPRPPRYPGLGGMCSTQPCRCPDSHTSGPKVLLPGFMHRPSHPAPPRHGLTPPWVRPVEPSCHAFLASASDVPSTHTHPRSRRGYPICWVRQLLSIFKCCCRNKDNLNLSRACFEEAQSTPRPSIPRVGWNLEE